MSELQQWTHIIIWALGATAAIVGLFLLASHLCWRLLVHIKGWPIVFKAMREYKKGAQQP